MIALGMDTSGKYLNLALMKGDRLLDGLHEECFRRQSERILPAIREMLAKSRISVDQVEALVVTAGPGSYTGIRIALTVAKVWARTKGIRLYKLDSLQLIAGSVPATAVYMDARAHRGYFGVFSSGSAEMSDAVITEEEFRQYMSLHPDQEFRGDLEPFGMHDDREDSPRHFADLREEWVRVDPVDLLGAKYLKDSSAYYTGTK